MVQPAARQRSSRLARPRSSTSGFSSTVTRTCAKRSGAEVGLFASRNLGRRPAVFARRRFGLTPGLPPILTNLGFRAALHATLDDGRFPQADGGKIRWEGLDNTTIDALARAPLDAGQHGSFIALAEKIGHAMDHDHVAPTRVGEGRRSTAGDAVNSLVKAWLLIFRYDR